MVIQKGEMSMLKKLFALLLILLLSFSMIACTPNAPADSDDKNEAGDDASNGEDEEGRATPPPAVMDLGGYEFKIRNDMWSEYDIAAPTQLNGQALSDTVYRRNKQVEGLYHVTIVECGKPSTTVNEIFIELSQYQSSGMYYADLYSTGANTMLGTFNGMGAFRNVYEIENFDLEQEWWDQDLLAATTFKDCAYVLTGDIQVNEDLRMQALATNYTLFQSNFPSTDLYKMVVEDKTWTIETFLGLLQSSGSDGGVSGQVDEGDRIGLSYDSSLGSTIFAAGGKRSFEIGEHNFKTYNFGIEKLGGEWAREEVTFAQWIYDFLHTDGLDTAQASGTVGVHAVQTYDGAREHFAADGVIFKTGYLLDAPKWYEEMESEIYYLPYPKHSNDQKEYHSLVHFTFQPVAIPKQVANAENTALVTEALAYYSDKLTNQVVDLVLPTLHQTDTNARNLLKLTLDSKCYDIDYITSMTGYFTNFSNLIATKAMDQYQAMSFSTRRAAHDKIEMYLYNY